MLCVPSVIEIVIKSLARRRLDVEWEDGGENSRRDDDSWRLSQVAVYGVTGPDKLGMRGGACYNLCPAGGWEAAHTSRWGGHT